MTKFGKNISNLVAFTKGVGPNRITIKPFNSKLFITMNQKLKKPTKFNLEEPRTWKNLRKPKQRESLRGKQRKIRNPIETSEETSLRKPRDLSPKTKNKRNKIK